MPSKGRLIALEGSRGPLLASTAQLLLDSVVAEDQRGGLSLWDASSIFFELRLGKAKKFGPSPHNLVLLYATDLAFRLRWQIQPGLDEGLTVIAAPYVESAMAFGAAVGLPKKWMDNLFEFAPKPQACYRLLESKEPPAEKLKAAEGYLEFCGSMLKHATPPRNPLQVRAGVLAYLDALEKRRRCKVAAFD